MCLLKREGKTGTLMMNGFVFLILANAAQLVFRHTPSLGEDLTDGVLGLLFGVAIASLLLAVWRNAHSGVNGVHRR
jgi:hypothetical protein